MKLKKLKFFADNLEANKKNKKSTWKRINELNPRNAFSHKTISNIKVGEETINTPEDIAWRYLTCTLLVWVRN